MTTDPQGRIWAVYDSTAFWFDEPTHRWNQFQYPTPISQSSGPIMEVVVDEEALWLASQLGGLWRVDRHDGEVRQFVNRPGDATSLSNNSLYCLSADPADASRLWIGTFGSGLCLFDKRTGLSRRFTQATGLPNNVVYSAGYRPGAGAGTGSVAGGANFGRESAQSGHYVRGRVAISPGRY